MTSAIASKISKLFEYKRPVNPYDPCCESSVLEPSSDLELMLLLNRTEPFLLQAPSGQGKSSYFSRVGHILRGRTWSHFRPLLIIPPEYSTTSRSSFFQFLARILASSPRAMDLGELITTSGILHHNSMQGIRTILLIDASRIKSEDTHQWIVHSVFKMGHEFRDVARDANIQILLSSSSVPQDLTTGPWPAYSFSQIRFRNLSESEIKALCRRVQKAASRFGHLKFQQDAVSLICKYAAGDKYYTNYLASKSVLEAGKDSRFNEIMVTGSAVMAAAEMIGNRTISDDRIKVQIQSLFDLSRDMLAPIHKLIEDGPSVWHGMRSDLRSILFRTGAVGLSAETSDFPNESFRVYSDKMPLPMFEIRNPMIAKWIGKQLNTKVLSSVAIPIGQQLFSGEMAVGNGFSLYKLVKGPLKSTIKAGALFGITTLLLLLSFVFYLENNFLVATASLFSGICTVLLCLVELTSKGEGSE